MSTAIDVRALIPLAEAARSLPFRPSPTTLWRWRVHGVQGHKLECYRAGRRWYTTAEALRAFIVAQSTSGSTDQSASHRSDATTRRIAAAGLTSRNGRLGRRKVQRE